MDKIISGNNIIYLNKRGERVITTAKLRKYMMSDDTATYEVMSKNPIPVRVNDTIDIFGQKYRLNNPPTVQKLNENSYKYTFKFDGVMWDMARCQFFNADGTGFKTSSDFSLIGTIDVFLLCLKNNMLRFSPDWEIGTYTNGETKTIAFSKDNCLSALQKICSEFKIEFRVDQANGKSIINTGKFGSLLPYTFQYGKGKGLYSLERTNVDQEGVINRIYVAGGSDNLPNAYRDYSTNLKLPGVDYLEDEDSISVFGLKEGFLDFPDIYPRRTGKITSLGSDEFKFIDNTMNFDLNEVEEDGITTKYLKPDVTAKVHFNTGMLAGYSFEIKKNGGYNHDTKEFEIIQFTNEQGQKFPDPNTEAFQFSEGDEYVLIDIWSPEIYISNAEQKLLEAALPEFEKEKRVKVNYRLDVDPKYMKEISLGGNHPINIGDEIHIEDQHLSINRDIPIMGFTRDLLQKFKYELDVADSYEIAFASQTVLNFAGVNNSIAQNSQIISKNNINGYKKIQKLNKLVFDTDGYFDTNKIKPLSIETNMLSAGAKSQILTLEGVIIEPNYESDPNVVKFSDGKLIHFTISDTEIKTWSFTTFTKSGLEPSEAYYLYAKCDRVGVQGEWLVTKEKIKFDQNPDYYHFLLGVLHPEANEIRYYTQLEGATTINGRYITTGKVQSVDGSTWFDLDLGAFLLNNQAGMSGKGIDTDAFLWAGVDYENRNSAPISMTKDGFLKIRNSEGQVVFEIGQKEGKAVFDIYNDEGVKVAQIGSSGIEFTNYVAESYNLQKLILLSEQNDTNTRQREDEVKQKMRVLRDIGNGEYEHYLNGSVTNSYTYNAGYNFESAMNSQYQGYYYESENKLGSHTNNGWYVFYFSRKITQNTEVHCSAFVFKIVDGKTTQMSKITETYNWNQMIIM